MDKIHISNITDITKDKIFYRDDRGDIAYIELEPCANRCEATCNILNKDEVAARCVGERLFAQYAYYELYTPEHTQIYMNLKTNWLKRFIYKMIGWNFHTKEFQQFYYIQKRLNANGWTTIDLS